MVDLLSVPEDSGEVLSARRQMIEHPQIVELITKAADWPGYPLKRHNDAKHPLYAISTLADFGLVESDPGMEVVVARILAHQSADYMLETPLMIPTAFGGSGREIWSWMLCDSPTLLYSLLSFGVDQRGHLGEALDHLSRLSAEIGWQCVGSPDLGKFKGPGRRDDPCPIANVYALKVLSLSWEKHESSARRGTEMLLHHWQSRQGKKYFLFGMGTDFAKLKYPFVWYDILHVAEVLSRFPWVHSDPRFLEMMTSITDQADEQGRYTAGSMYMAWKGWSFADKKIPSPWITYLILRIQSRISNKNQLSHSLLFKAPVAS
jgi:hypothetical protein